MGRLISDLVLALLIIVEYIILVFAIASGAGWVCDFDCENCPMYPPCTEAEKQEIRERILEEEK